MARRKTTRAAPADPIDPKIVKLHESISEKFGDHLGYSSDPRDVIWMGRDANIDIDEWIESHLGRRHPLENILSAIIEGNPLEGESWISADARMDRVLKVLVGAKGSRGRKLTRWPLLVLIARELWLRHEYVSDPDNGKFAKAARDVLEQQSIDLGNRGDDSEKNLIDELRREFLRNEDLLLKMVTVSDSEEQNWRRAKEEKVLSLLRELGVTVGQPEAWKLT